MKDETFVRMPIERVAMLHGQVGNIRYRLEVMQRLITAPYANKPLELCAEALTELDILEKYLPQMIDEAPF